MIENKCFIDVPITKEEEMLEIIGNWLQKKSKGNKVNKIWP